MFHGLCCIWIEWKDTKIIEDGWIRHSAQYMNIYMKYSLPNRSGCSPKDTTLIDDSWTILVHSRCI